jgi:ribosomal protein S18 acetylase RimI-like enzyme
MLRIIRFHADTDVEEIRRLFTEYWQSFGCTPCFQGFDTELATLPGPYRPPAGCILTAEYGAKTAGCVALRPLDPGNCELKRLYVRPEFRGNGIGIELTRTIIEEARQRHNSRIRLDTMPVMTTAIRMYESLGFHDIPPYLDDPTPGARCMELTLL